MSLILEPKLNTEPYYGPALDQVVLEAYTGTDLDVVNAAKVSFAKQSFVYGDDEKGILRFLMKAQHGSPFEHNYFKFRVRAPVVVLWEWVRHRIGFSYNVESARYTELREAFYIPAPEFVRLQFGRPGRYSFEPINDPTLVAEFQNALREHSVESFKQYNYWVKRGVAKEIARLFMGFNLYTEFYVSCNARSLMNFLALRNNVQAMLEIQQYAKVLERLWAEKMPDTAEAFVNNERIAP